MASAVEFLLEGLHLQRRLNKDRGPRRRDVPALAASSTGCRAGSAGRVRRRVRAAGRRIGQRPVRARFAERLRALAERDGGGWQVPVPFAPEEVVEDIPRSRQGWYLEHIGPHPLGVVRAAAAAHRAATTCRGRTSRAGRRRGIVGCSRRSRSGHAPMAGTSTPCPSATTRTSSIPTALATILAAIAPLTPIPARVSPDVMAFLTPDPRHLDRPTASPRVRDATLAGGRAVPGVGRLAGRPGPDARTRSSTRSRTTSSSTATCPRRCATSWTAGLRASDPSRGDLRGLRDLLDRLRDRRREILRAGPARRPARRRPAAAGRDRRAGAGGRPAAARRRRTRRRRRGGRRAGTDPELQRMLREHRGQAARQPRRAAARRRRPDPRPPGLRLHRRRGPPAVRRPPRPAPRQHARPDEPGARGRRQVR